MLDFPKLFSEKKLSLMLREPFINFLTDLLFQQTQVIFLPQQQQSLLHSFLDIVSLQNFLQGLAFGVSHRGSQISQLNWFVKIDLR